MEGNTIYSFQRIEKKYMLNQRQYDELIKKMEPYMQQDQYGLHTICNLYYDTEHYDLISHSIEKPVYKEKMRLRSYGVPGKEDRVFLEIKKKYAGTVYKRRIGLKLQEAYRCLDEGRCSGGGQINREIDYFIHFYHPVPKQYIAYDRIALFGKEDSEIRITFDRNIRSRSCDLALEEGDYGEQILPAGNYLMEIKVPAAMPLWLVHFLEELKIYPCSFSKYGEVYKNIVEHRNNSDRSVYCTDLMKKGAIQPAGEQLLAGHV